MPHLYNYRPDFLKLIYDNSKDGFWDGDLVNNKIYISKTFISLFELDKDKHTYPSDWFFGIIHPDDLASVTLDFQNHLENKTPYYSNQHRVRKSNGEYIWVSCRAQVVERDENNVPLRVVGTTLDISREKSLEYRAYENEQRLSEAQRVANIGSWEFDIATEKFFWSDQLYHMLRINPLNKNFTIQDIYDLIHPADKKNFDLTVKRVFEEGSRYEIEYRIIRPDDTICWLLGKGEGVFRNNQLVSLRGTVQDITDRKILERALDEEKIRTTQLHKQTSLGMLATNLSHEINNPLAIISGNLSIIKSQIDIPNLFIFFNSMAEAIERIQKITDTLNYFSPQKGQEEFSVIFIYEIIQELKKIFSSNLEEKNISLISDFDKSLVIYGPKSEILHIFFNLISNSIFFNSQESNSWIKVSAKEEADFIEVRVMDSGLGVQSQFQDKLFDPFYTTKEPGQGLGLGLPIVKYLIENMQGSISYESFEEHPAFTLKFLKLK